MIEKIPAYQTSDGATHKDIKFARRHELMMLLSPDIVSEGEQKICEAIVQNSEAVIAILQSTGRKPRERRKKPGRPKGSRNKSEVPAESNGLTLQQQTNREERN